MLPKSRPFDNVVVLICYFAMVTGPQVRREPRWPALVALLGVAGLQAALPSTVLVAGPRWLLLAIVVVLLVPTAILHRRGRHDLDRVLGYVLNGVVTFAMIVSLALLITALTEHRVNPSQILRSAAALWVTNILVFAS